MLEQIEGIIISEKPYGETSKIIQCLTKEYGIIGILAKGSKNLKSDLRSVTCKLIYGTFHIYYKKDKLSTLVSVDVINPFKNIMKDLTKISYASFLVDLTQQVYKQNPSIEIYELLIHALEKINDNYDPFVITNIIELKFLHFLGVMPIIDKCSTCGSTSEIVTMDSNRGGYICKNCYKNEKIVSEKTLKLIRMYYYVDISKISKLEVSQKSKIEINSFLDDYYDRYTGLYLKNKSLIHNLTKVEFV